jgi:hypothetical protein
MFDSLESLGLSTHHNNDHRRYSNALAPTIYDVEYRRYVQLMDDMVAAVARWFAGWTYLASVLCNEFSLQHRKCRHSTYWTMLWYLSVLPLMQQQRGYSALTCLLLHINT